MSEPTSGRSDHHRLLAGLQASQRSRIDSFIVMDVMRAAAAREAAGDRVIHMEVGQPATPAPKAARRALAARLETDGLGYSLALGIDALRERIAAHYQITYGVSVAPERVVVTTGSSGGFLLAFLAAFDAGDAVALPQPGYPCYRHILSALGQPSVALPTGPDNRFMPTAAAITEAARARADLRGVLIASPANPTGTMLSRERLAEVTTACRDNGLWFISDEIYHGLAYGPAVAQAQTALAHSPDAIVINSFSKYYSMTGWRVGWMIVPDRLVRTVERLQQNLFICAPVASQVAALGAFEAGEELEANRLVYERNRDVLLAELPKAGLATFAPADGAFYLYCDVRHLTDDSRAFAARMLAETGVAATPGIDFDPVNGRFFLRFSYAGATADMVEAAHRLTTWARTRRG
ncbi:MAG: aminotransferase class I/II-fold pyridoxal phosphate-dependent enzyme [Hyphomicrobiaceae bacterium]|nr:aminotransferase class I/II-fold pyridoxal phosphate-dependent enzyme [Hyphomicrobiaceae bacterium]